MAETKANYTTIVALGIGAYFLNKLISKDKGDKSGKEATEEVETSEGKNNPFSYASYVPPKIKAGKFRISMTPTKIVDAGQRIYNGIGYVADNEAEIMSGIKMAGTKTDIAVISSYYSKHYKTDLYEKLKKNLSKKELGRINLYVTKLPDYSSTGYKS